MNKLSSSIEIAKVHLLTYESEIVEKSKEYRIFFMQKGNAQFNINGTMVEHNKNTVILVNHDEILKTKLSRNAEIILINLPKSNVLRYSDYESVTFECNSVLKDSVHFSELRKIIMRIYRLSLDKDSNLVLNSQFLVLLNELLVHFAITTQKDDESKERFEKHFRRNIMIKEFIEENFNQDISLSDLAEELDLSLSYTSRFFNEQFGISFTDYVNGLRILNASQDLIMTDLTIIKIAMINGFTNVSRFNSVFKEKYGITPSVYRTTKRKEIQETQDDGEFLDFSTKHQNKLNSSFKKYIKSDVVNTKYFEVDVTTKPEILNTNFRKIMNFGDISKIKDLNSFQSNLSKSVLYGYEYVRVNVDLNKILNNEKKHFFNVVDEIYAHNLKPYLILDQNDLSSTNIRKFLSESVNKLGISTVRSWLIEITIQSKSRNDLNDILVSLLNVLNLINIGVGLGNNIKISCFKDNMEALQNYYFGFVSIGYYFDDHPDNHNSIYSSSEYFEEIKGILNSNFKKVSLIIGEWGFQNNKTVIHDTLFYGSFIIEFMIMALKYVDLMGYTLINDEYFEERTIGLFDGSPGLTTPNSIEKPSGHSYIFLKKLGEEILFESKNIIVTRRNDFEYLIIGHNTHELNDYYHRNKDRIAHEDKELIFGSESVFKADVNINNLPQGKYKLKTYILDKYNGDIIELWRDLGHFTELQPDELSNLKSKSIPKLRLKMIENSSSITIPVELRRNNYFMTYIYRML